MSEMLSGTYYIIVKDMEVLKDIVDKASKDKSNISFVMEFNASGNRDIIMDSINILKDQLSTHTKGSYLEALELGRENFMGLYGGLLFLGIFLGILFMLATALIIYYKQVSEGFEDRERFQIMQKVGMDKSEVKKTIKSQIIMIFSIPIVTAVIHLAFAFKMITKLLMLLNLTNIPLFIGCTAVTIAVFTVLYLVVYALTARTYYNIVE